MDGEIKKIVFTPSLFYHYSICPHWIWNDIYGDPEKKKEISEFTSKILEEGVLHEEKYIQGLDAVKIETKDVAEGFKETLKHMKKGAPLIYQGSIQAEIDGVQFRGRPDLLEKHDGKSQFGNWFYAPVDIKSSRELKPEHLMQLALYGMILERIQNFFPEEVSIINRDFTHVRHILTLLDRDKTKKKINDILAVIRGAKPPLTLTSACHNSNPWWGECLKEAVEKNDLALIYNFNSKAFDDLRANGINTVADLAHADLSLLPKIRFASPEVLDKKRMQAKALIEKKVIRLSSIEMPEAPLKIFFDIEGDPFLNVEYLFGFWISEAGRDPYYKYFLAEKPEEEGKMWQEFLLWVKNLPENYKVYHYHHYESVKLKQLGERYSRIPELQIFENSMFDMAKMVMESVIFPVYFYSIKDIAKYLGFSWRHEKAGGAQSILWYEEWLEKKDRGVLEDVIKYNEDDVRATEFLYEWLKNPQNNK